MNKSDMLLLLLSSGTIICGVWVSTKPPTFQGEAPYAWSAELQTSGRSRWVQRPMRGTTLINGFWVAAVGVSPKSPTLQEEAPFAWSAELQTSGRSRGVQLDLLELDIWMLLSCDLLATKGRNEICENSPSPDAMAARTRSQLKNHSQRQLTNVTTCFGSHMPCWLSNGRSWDWQIQMQSSALTFSLPAPSSSTLTNWPRQRIMLSLTRNLKTSSSPRNL
jgi:hypothetical protein